MKRVYFEITKEENPKVYESITGELRKTGLHIPKKTIGLVACVQKESDYVARVGFSFCSKLDDFNTNEGRWVATQKLKPSGYNSKKNPFKKRKCSKSKHYSQCKCK